MSADGNPVAIALILTKRPRRDAAATFAGTYMPWNTFFFLRAGLVTPPSGYERYWHEAVWLAWCGTDKDTIRDASPGFG